jgi:hypothetical protein
MDELVQLAVLQPSTVFHTMLLKWSYILHIDKVHEISASDPIED